MKNLMFIFIFLSIQLAGQRDVCSIILPDSFVYFTSGQIKQHKDVCTNGNRIIIDTLGNITLQCVMKNCMNNGYYRLFYDNLNPKEFGSIVSDIKQGAWLYWNEEGKLIKKEYYRDDIIIDVITY